MSKYTNNKQGWKKKRRRRASGRPSLPQLSKDGAKNIILLGIIAVIAGSLLLVIIMAFISRGLPNPNSLTERTISQTTKIYDRTGDHLLYEIFGEENRTLKKLQAGFCLDDNKIEFDPAGIPLFAVQATISAEDRKFCSHGGFDVKGILRAILSNLRGNRVGGSTLTQQLVKNAILSNEKTYTRKIKELILSVELERRYSKDEILQIYFNEIPYGSTYYGMEAAAQNYFQTSVNELTLGQAATLAALPKAPTTYLNNPDRLQARRDWILGEMKDLEFITEEQEQVAKEEDNTIESKFVNIEAPHFVLLVKEQLEEIYGRRSVEEGGLKVLTTLDYDKQIIAEEEVAKGVEERGETYGFSNASLVAIDPKNGHVLSMVGSKDYFDDEIDGQVNIATRLRQPGSSFKPIIYTKSFEMGYTPNTVIWDVVTTFPSTVGPYTPHNYDGKERGPVRMRSAVQGSLNIPAVKMIYMIGVENALNFATSLGYTSFDNHANFGLSLVLGGGEVQLLEHTNAYATFANEGIHHNMVTILRVEDSKGDVLEEWKKKDGKRVLNANAARTITHVLKDNDARTPFFGAGNPLQLGGRPVAAKTGTTNDYRDGWLMGYTPSIAVGVWAGNNDNTAMKGAGGSTAAGPIWNGFMRRALENSPIEAFNSPNIPITGKAVLDGTITSSKIVIDKASGKIATEFTPDSMKEERLFAEYHSLLHYIDRSDPTGSPPKKPEKDPQYTAWETAIQQWIIKQEEETGEKITQSAPPTEFDDIHIPKNFPSANITLPSENTSLDERDIIIEVDASAKRGIKRVEFFLNGLYLGSDSVEPFKLSTEIPNSIPRGLHTLKVIAFDDVDNAGSDTISIKVNSDASEAKLELLDPKNGQTIERNVETFTVVASLKNPNDYHSITVFAERIGGGSKQIVGQVLSPSSPFVTFDWSIPETGRWALSAKANPSNGSSTITTAGTVVEILPGIIPEDIPADENTPLDENGDPIVEEEVFAPDEDLTIF